MQHLPNIDASSALSASSRSSSFSFSTPSRWSASARSFSFLIVCSFFSKNCSRCCKTVANSRNRAQMSRRTSHDFCSICALLWFDNSNLFPQCSTHLSGLVFQPHQKLVHFVCQPGRAHEFPTALQRQHGAHDGHVTRVTSRAGKLHAAFAPAVENLSAVQRAAAPVGDWLPCWKSRKSIQHKHMYIWPRFTYCCPCAKLWTANWSAVKAGECWTLAPPATTAGGPVPMPGATRLLDGDKLVTGGGVNTLNCGGAVDFSATPANVQAAMIRLRVAPASTGDVISCARFDTRCCVAWWNWSHWVHISWLQSWQKDWTGPPGELYL